MAKRKAPKRTKTKYANIYFNEQSKLYDIKYNYKVYNLNTKKNDYKAKWVYGIATIGQAQSELAKLRANGPKPQDKDITLQGAFELWETKTVVNKGSPITINNTKQQLKMIAQFLPLDTKLKDSDGTLRYVITSNKARDRYFLYTKENGDWKKTAKARSPIAFEGRVKLR